MKYDLADEIRLLVDMVIEHVTPWLDRAFASEHSEQRYKEYSGRSHAHICCPLCGLLAVVVEECPDLVSRVLEQMAQLIALLRAVLADRWESHEGLHMPGFQPRSHSASANKEKTTSVRVQHIPVRSRLRQHE